MVLLRGFDGALTIATYQVMVGVYAHMSTYQALKDNVTIGYGIRVIVTLI